MNILFKNPRYKTDFTIIILFFCSMFHTLAQEPFNGASNPENIASWEITKPGAQISFVSTNKLYDKYKAPFIDIEIEWKTKAWKGEKVHTQLLLWTTVPLEEAQVKLSDLKGSNSNEIAKENIEANFIGYVMADGLASKAKGCNMKPRQDSLLVADIINKVKIKDIAAKITQPIWLSIDIPKNTPGGTYTGSIYFIAKNSRELGHMNYSIEVIDRVLPDPKDWEFHLDLWQNPDAIARVHNVKKWSDEHFEAMKPYMKMLANAGQKVVTTTLIYDPWNSQTYDVYDSMIKWTKKRDGSWNYDYTIFDKYVEYMLSVGIDKLIECYSMIPWNLKFYYFDEALGKNTFIVAEPGSPEYKAHWKPMLADFAEHLKQKGWFDKTTIAMDERPMEDMKKAISIIKSADEDFKISLAGNYHPEIKEDIFDYCVASNQIIDDKTMAERKKKGFTTTFYTCCVEEYPNTFTVSPPAESTWLAWHAAFKGYDGYLRWAYNSWPKNPLQDSRFGTWPSGDTYLVYPGARSSIRFERLIEGIEDYEKIRILTQEFKNNNQVKKLKTLEEVLKKFEINTLKNKPAGEMVNNAQGILNSL